MNFKAKNPTLEQVELGKRSMMLLRRYGTYRRNSLHRDLRRAAEIFPAKDIAEALGVSVPTVYGWLRGDR